MWLLSLYDGLPLCKISCICLSVLTVQGWPSEFNSERLEDGRSAFPEPWDNDEENFF